MGQIGPREIGANLAFGVNLALFILQCAANNVRHGHRGGDTRKLNFFIVRC